MANLSEVTDANFEAEVLQSQEPVFVDFWGPSCPPCRMIAPVVEELAAQNGEKMKFAKVNVEEHLQAATQFGVMNIPTLMIFKGGDVVERFVGVQPKNRLQEAIDQATA